MPQTLDANLRRELADRLRYYHELGIYDFYRRERTQSDASESVAEASEPAPTSPFQPELREEMAARKPAVVAAVAEENIFDVLTPKLEDGVADPKAALNLIREDLGDCTRC